MTQRPRKCQRQVMDWGHAEGHGMRLVYVGDSGAEVSGSAWFSWIEVPEQVWSPVLGAWLDFRDGLWRHHGVG